MAPTARLPNCYQECQSRQSSCRTRPSATRRTCIDRRPRAPRCSAGSVRATVRGDRVGGLIAVGSGSSVRDHGTGTAAFVPHFLAAAGCFLRFRRCGSSFCRFVLSGRPLASNLPTVCGPQRTETVPSRCSQIVTRQPASVPRHELRPSCHTRSPHCTVLSFATTRSCCTEKMRSRSWPYTGTKAWPRSAAAAANFRFISGT